MYCVCQLIGTQATVEFTDDGHNSSWESESKVEPQYYTAPLSLENKIALKYAKIGYKQEVLVSMMEFIQMKHMSGKERDDTFSASFYDALREIHYDSVERDNTRNSTSPPTFYFYVAGGAELQALPCVNFRAVLYAELANAARVVPLSAA
jgi:hypothetical protein